MPLPSWARIAQQVLAYLNVPHDAEPRENEQRILRASAKDSELQDDSPDRLGEALDTSQISDSTSNVDQSDEDAQTSAGDGSAGNESSDANRPDLKASLKQPDAAVTSSVRKEPLATGSQQQSSDAPATAAAVQGAPAGAVVLDVAAGAVVPSLIGKPLRAAIEETQQAGFELEAIGSGVAREQSPPPGARLPLGGKVSVRFAR